MITKDMIFNGIRNGTITFIVGQQATYAQELKKAVQSAAKKERYSALVETQMAQIIDQMLRGNDCARWVFDDMAYYNNHLEETWVDEFAYIAKLEFESKGFCVASNFITW